MVHSGPPLEVKTAEAKVPQPTALPPKKSQGVMTRSKTGTLGSAMLLSSAPPAPIPGGGTVRLEPPRPQALIIIIIDISPLPWVVSSLASFCLPLGGQKQLMTSPTSSWPHLLRATVKSPFGMPSGHLPISRPQQLSINSHWSLIWMLPIPTRGHRTISCFFWRWGGPHYESWSSQVDHALPLLVRVRGNCLLRR